MALVKAWPVAGDLAVGHGFLRRVRPFVYGRPFREAEIAEVRRIKREIDRKIAARDESARNVKLGIGGIREIEFVGQILELASGRRATSARELRNTLGALAGSRGAPPALRPGARCARATPTSSCATSRTSFRWWPTPRPTPCPSRRTSSGYARDGLAIGADAGADPAAALMRDYRAHTEAVHRIFEAVLSGQERPGGA